MSGTPDNPRFTEQREQISTWLQEDGYAIQDLPPQPGYAWLLIAIGELGEYGLSQLRERPAAVHVTGHIDLWNATGGKTNGLDDDEIWQLRLGLLGMGLDSFSGVGRPLGRVALGVDIYWDGMTRNDFASALRSVRNGLSFLLLSVRRALGEPATPESEAGPLPS